jgi:hypothetical protein
MMKRGINLFQKFDTVYIKTANKNFKKEKAGIFSFKVVAVVWIHVTPPYLTLYFI